MVSKRLHGDGRVHGWDFRPTVTVRRCTMLQHWRAGALCRPLAPTVDSFSKPLPMSHFRILGALAAAASLLAPTASAQTGASCLPTINPFLSNNGGGVGGAVYFDMTVNGAVTLTDMVMNYSATAGTTVGVDVYTCPTSYVGNEGNSGAWTLVSSGTGTSAGTDLRTVCTLTTPALLTPGTYGVALVAVGSAHRYTNGTGANQNFSDPLLSLSLGAATNTPFGGSPFSPRVANIEICYTPGSGFASHVPFGDGCGAGDPGSYYELFDGAGNPNDLSNTPGLTAFWTGTSYVITPGAAPIVTPSATAINLGAGDDTITQVTLPWPLQTQAGTISDIFVSSNGYVSFTPTTSSDFTESVGELLGNAETRIACYWDDLNPSSASTLGGVFVEQDPANANLFHITWDQVVEFNASTTNTFQLSINAGGGYELKYGAMAALDGLVGYSPGNGAADPGSTDLTAINGAIVLGDDRRAVALAGVNRPVIGQTSTLETRDIPAGSISGFHIIGTNQIPGGGLDLSLVYMPGCRLYAAADVTVGFAATTASVQHNLAIPNNSSLAGAHLYSQSIIVSPGINPLGVITTNAIDSTIDAN